ncbi:MAG TPA: hypothetical protein PKB07_09905 [Flavilitoribacter sp.]|nr:hypothetical protein [Flavilitoribacter sp.]
MKRVKLIASLILVAGAISMISAQQTEIQYYRSNNKDGLNVFEPSKTETTTFEGMKVRVGGSFTQQFQGLKHGNTADPVDITYNGKTVNGNELYNLGSGFNLATANLNLDFQLDDGIRVALENYMSSRHHSEFWVKGGYIQIDKLPMFNNPEWFTKYLRVKIGHFQPNYGDQGFRRSDNGNAILNPFVGNYILDAFTTEIGGEVYLFPTNDLMLMVGATNGLIGGSVDASTASRKPSIYFKAAYDKQVSEDFRFRLSGSVYTNAGAGRNTLYAGDRTGSRFYFAMEPRYTLDRATGVYVLTTADNRATSGRISPDFTYEVMAVQVSPFVKYKGLEVFATYETAKGTRAASETDKRKFGQWAAEGVYRFFPNEQAFIGARYNEASGRLAGFAADVSINRMEVSAGWFPTRNLMLKAAYVNQNYVDFPSSDYRAEGYFKGVMIEAVVGL